MTINRRKLLANSAASCAIGIAGLSLAGTSAAFGADGDMYDVKKLMLPDGRPDHFLGNEEAKVTIIEYASSTCPHCANFHVGTFPELKKEYIDTGKVRFTLRPFVLNILDAVVFMLAYKAGETSTENYYTIVDAYMKTQSQWTQSSTPRDALLEIAQQYGFTKESFDAALEDKEIFEGMEKIRDQASKEFDMHGTPSFYMNGKMLAGNQSFEAMAEQIEPLLG